MVRGVISASRRTDIPAFYMNWFMESLRKGSFEVENPVSHKIIRVDSTPKSTAVIVFWSRNYAPLMPRLDELLNLYNLWFHFTINTPNKTLEPNVPNPDIQLAQLRELVKKVETRAITWRFDPIVFWREKGKLKNNLDGFRYLTHEVSHAGITRCYISFMTHYRKIQRRLQKYPHITFVDPPIEEKVEIILTLHEMARSRGIQLQLCCQPEILKALPENALILPASCVDGKMIGDVYGVRVSRARDTGQREGCGCTRSRDIGSYQKQICHYHCLYCYANP